MGHQPCPRGRAGEAARYGLLLVAPSGAASLAAFRQLQMALTIIPLLFVTQDERVTAVNAGPVFAAHAALVSVAGILRMAMMILLGL